MFQILRHYGIPFEIVQAIRVIYTNSKSKVIVDGKFSDEFPVTTGVLQGDTLAPLLFIIVIDYVMKNAVSDAARERDMHGFLANKREGTRHQETKPAACVNDLDFSDDIALLENNRTDCQAQLTITSKRANEVGLRINYKKTEIMKTTGDDTKITVDGHEIEYVNNFKYLGSMMLSSESDFLVRRGQAWAVFEKMKSIWRSKVVDIKLKAKLFRWSCVSILTYGSESWILTDKLAKQIDSFSTTAYRRMLGIHWTDKVSNERLYQMTDQRPLSEIIQQRQLRFIGHILRREPTELVNQYALYTPKENHGKRGRGRPATSYAKYFARLINNTVPPTESEIRALAANRERWRKIVVDCKSIRLAAEG